ncbi:MAG TPA: leucine-rich repeat protein [Bacilli bacterium]|nr:MAG: hypothetical protein BWY97_01332 [Tenericutes bacterium ADurb.BinA124]HNZ50026.1 leucine-rich repeat protein [Bacilli bacterium]HPX84160.1 leucine-rich repeat protein [Bacilli bacterium]
MLKKFNGLLFVVLMIAVAFIFTACKNKETFSLTLPTDGSVIVEAPTKLDLLKIKENTTITLKVNVPANKEVATFKVNNVDKPLTDNRFSFVITENITITVSFKDLTGPDVETFSINLPTDNTVVVISPEVINLAEVEKNTEVTIKVNVPANKEVATFKVNGADKSLTDNQFSFVVTENVTVVVTYKDIEEQQKTYKLTLPNNVVSNQSDNLKVLAGTKIILTVAYDIASEEVKVLTVDGVSKVADLLMSPTKTISFTMPNHDVIVKFEKAIKTYSLTFDNNLFELLTPGIDLTQVPHGTSVEFHFIGVVPENKKFKSLLIDGVDRTEIIDSQTLKFTVVIVKNTTIDAVLEDVYKLTLDSDYPDGIAVLTPIDLTLNRIESNTEVTVRVTIPDTRYVVDFKVNDLSVTLVDNQHTLTVTSDVTLKLITAYKVSTASSFAFILLNEGTPEEGYTVKEFIGNEVIVKIPSEYQNKPVKYLETDAFKNNGYAVLELEIPQSIQMIDQGALFGLSSLTKLTIPFIGRERDYSGPSSVEKRFFYIFGETNYPNTYPFFTTTESAYYLPNDLKEVSITDTDMIPEKAFCANYIANETKITITDYIHLEKINLPSGLILISDYAFFGCLDLKAIVIPEATEEIKMNAFGYCLQLTEFTIPKNVSYIFNSAFYLSHNLLNIYVSEDNPHYISVNGVVYSKDLKTILLYPVGREESYQILEGTETIFASAFLSSKITAVNLPNSIKTIEQQAFSQCNNLSDIVIPDTVTEIKEGAFMNAALLANVKLSNNISKIAANLFNRCHLLTTIVIPDQVVEIGEGAFNQSGLTEIRIPSNVKTIKNFAFYKAPNLRNVIFYEGLLTIGENAFSANPQLTNITLPHSLEKIDESAFSYCEELTVIFVDTRVINMGANVFKSCDKLTIKTPITFCPDTWNPDWNPDNRPVNWRSAYVNVSLTLPTNASVELVSPIDIDLNSIPVNTVITVKVVVQAGQTLKKFVVGYDDETDKLNENNEYTFTITEPTTIMTTMAGLFKLSLPSDGSITVTSPVISDYDNIPERTEITVAIRDEIGKMPNLFINDSMIAGVVTFTFNLNFDTTLRVEYWDKYYLVTLPNDGSIKIIQPTGVISNTVLKDTEVVLEVEIPAGHKLTEFRVNGEITTLPENNQYSFISRKDMAFTTVIEVEQISETSDGIFEYGLGNDGSDFYTVIAYLGTEAVVVVPETFNGKPVKYIGSEAFKNNTGITELTLPNSLVKLDDGVLSGMSNLTKLTIPFVGCDRTTNDRFAGKIAYIFGQMQFPNSMVGYYAPAYDNNKKYYIPISLTEVIITDATRLPDVAFGTDGSSHPYYSNNISQISITSNLEYIGQNVFCNSKITEFILPSTVKTIESGAFMSCTSLTSISLPQNLEYIGSFAFTSSGLKEISIPANVTTANGVFSGCQSLTKAVFQSGFKKIEASTFAGCSNLTSLTIPDTVTTIGNAAFAYCPALMQIFIPNSVTTIGSTIFNGCQTTLQIRCAAASKPSGWNSQWNYNDGKAMPVVWGATN